MTDRGIDDYIRSLKNYQALSPFIVSHREIPGTEAEFAEPEIPLSEPVSRLLGRMGLHRLYAHQARAIDRVRRGIHTVVATPTASGKTLIYNIPVLEKILEDPESRALYLFPLKALAQDQLKSLREMLDGLALAKKPQAEIYDGDTPSHRRSKIRKNPPNVVLSNPEMLHLAILPFHDRWAEFIGKLRYVIVDEVHSVIKVPEEDTETMDGSFSSAAYIKGIIKLSRGEGSGRQAGKDLVVWIDVPKILGDLVTRGRGVA